MHTRSLILSLAVASCLAAAGATAAEPSAPNTSEWTCSKCPFPKGYQADATLGGGYLDDSSAKFGRYTGLDEKGGYVVADAEGSYASESGYGLSYELTDLGLNSRAVDITAAGRAPTSSGFTTTASRSRSGTRPRRRSITSAART
jgi:hypothetical protein